MKRIASLVLFVIFGLILAACGASGDGGTAATASEGPQTASTEASAAAEVEASAAAEGEAAASAEPTPVTVGAEGGQPLVVWHNWGGGYATTISELLGTWASENNVSLELLQTPDIGTKVNVSVPAGQGPDIIAWVNDQIGKNAELGVIQPLDDKGFDRAYLEQNFNPTAVNAMVYNDQVWGVPESMESIAIIYNRDLVSEEDLPANTDELIQQATEWNAANSGKYYFVYQAGTAAGDAYHNAPWWYGNGAYYVDEAGEVGLASAESVAAGELLQQFATIMPAEIDYDVSRALFTENNAAMWMTGPWALADVEAAGINYGVAPIPQISANGQPAKPFVGVKIMMLAEGAKNPEGAAQLMQYYGSPEFQAELATANKQVPANTQAAEQVSSDEVIAAFSEQASNGVPLPNTPFMDALWAPAGEAQAAIWTGTQEPQAALEAAAQVATESVDQIR